MKKKIRAVAGGTAASKTVSILIWMIDYAQVSDGEVLTIVAESVPHLKLGAIRDFKNIMIGNGYWNEKNWNETDHIYRFEKGSIIEFISFDKFGKAHGPRRDVLFVNECNNIPYNIVDQLITRTRKVVWLDWNPSSEFWFYTEMLPHRIEDIDFITLTYKDNEALEEEQVKEIESHKHNKNWWTVYGLGQLGTIEGRIYTDWAIIDELPHEARLERYGLDFGWSSANTAIVAVYYYNGGYILDEELYRKGMLNKDIADFLKNQKPAMIVADSAEPKSIEDIRQYGLNITGAKKLNQKWGDTRSFNHWAINMVQEQRISVTKRSVNLIKESRNYLWKVDKDGRILNEPEDGKDDCLDAAKYALITVIPIIRSEEIRSQMPMIKRKLKKNPAR